MIEEVLKTIEQYNLIEDGDKLVLAVSGGPDSIAMLDILNKLRKNSNTEEKKVKEKHNGRNRKINKIDFQICVAHVNHMIREEAKEDEKYVKNYCEKNGIEFYSKSIDVQKIANNKKIGTEEAGRVVRYEFFDEILEKTKSNKIAIAHNKNDRAETIIMNISRGSGIKGARGIPPKRENIIRPLILASRADTEEYCKSHNISYVNDSTNSERIYTRNKVRLDVVPVLRTINPSIEDAFLRFAKNMSTLDEFIEKSAQNALTDSKIDNGYSCEKLKILEKPVLARVIEIICSEKDVEPESVHIELIQKAIEKGGAVSVKNGVTAVASQGIFRIYREENRNKTDVMSEIPIFINKTVIVYNKRVRTELVNIEEFNKRIKFTKNLFNISLDYDTISDIAVFRNRSSGDYISPKGRNITKPLRKLMSELKIPAEKRDDMILLADGNNILWAEKIGVSEMCSIKSTTQKVLIIYIEE